MANSSIDMLLQAAEVLENTNQEESTTTTPAKHITTTPTPQVNSSANCPSSTSSISDRDRSDHSPSSENSYGKERYMRLVPGIRLSWFDFDGRGSNGGNRWSRLEGRSKGSSLGWPISGNRGSNGSIKTVHNTMEKNRRDYLRRCLDQLRQVVPEQAVMLNKSNVLGNSLDALNLPVPCSAEGLPQQLVRVTSSTGEGDEDDELDLEPLAHIANGHSLGMSAAGGAGAACRKRTIIGLLGQARNYIHYIDLKQRNLQYHKAQLLRDQSLLKAKLAAYKANMPSSTASLSDIKATVGPVTGNENAVLLATPAMSPSSSTSDSKATISPSKKALSEGPAFVQTDVQILLLPPNPDRVGGISPGKVDEVFPLDEEMKPIPVKEPLNGPASFVGATLGCSEAARRRLSFSGLVKTDEEAVGAHEDEEKGEKAGEKLELSKADSVSTEKESITNNAKSGLLVATPLRHRTGRMSESRQDGPAQALTNGMRLSFVGTLNSTLKNGTVVLPKFSTVPITIPTATKRDSNGVAVNTRNISASNSGSTSVSSAYASGTHSPGSPSPSQLPIIIAACGSAPTGHGPLEQLSFASGSTQSINHTNQTQEKSPSVSVSAGTVVVASGKAGLPIGSGSTPSKSITSVKQNSPNGHGLQRLLHSQLSTGDSTGTNNETSISIIMHPNRLHAIFSTTGRDRIGLGSDRHGLYLARELEFSNDIDWASMQRMRNMSECSAVSAISLGALSFSGSSADEDSTPLPASSSGEVHTTAPVEDLGACEEVTGDP